MIMSVGSWIFGIGRSSRATFLVPLKTTAFIVPEDMVVVGWVSEWVLLGYDLFEGREPRMGTTMLNCSIDSECEYPMARRWTQL